MEKPKSVDAFIALYPQWTKELNYLRAIALETEMEENIKWMFPTYSHKGKNIISIFASKSYAGIWFFQGYFLLDKAKKLVNAQEGKTKAMRQWRFDNIEEIKQNADLLRSYIFEAIHHSEQGKEIKPVRNTKPLVIPPELKQLFLSKPILYQSYEQLSLSKKREYAEYIANAKRAETKNKRLEKIEPLIHALKGLNDKYRK